MSEQNVALEQFSPETETLSSVDRWARKAVRTRLRAIRLGSLTLIDGEEVEHYGETSAALRATVYVESPRFYRALALRGPLGGAESYMEGHWKCDDLTAVVRVLAVNREAVAALDPVLVRWIRPSLALLARLRGNTRAASRRDIAAHYDLGNEFFELFLDPTLTYSSGIFESPGSTMEQASVAKFERICRKLQLGPDDHVLEIGTGWGGFALHAAKHHGCRVTTTTISRRQYELACRRVAEAGLADRVDVRLEDYRDLRGCYDKIVSIEMIEAVGHAHLETFFRVCGELLRPEGAMLLQAITIPERDYRAHTRSVDFIKRYIFPGGELVSVGATNHAASQGGNLQLSHLEDLSPHYAETLRRWRHRMFQNMSRIRQLGLSESFLRMWEFYLCYCEGGFEERQIGVVQALFEKSGARRERVLGRVA